MNFWNFIFGVIIIALIISALFDVISWELNWIAIAIVFVLWMIAMYNSMVSFKNRVKDAWSDIDVQLKRRYDLIPNLIETVKAYAKHEREVFERVTDARSKAINASSVQEQQEAENMLSDALKSLFAVSENYPSLRANENFLELQRELTDTENKIQAARRFYNSNVREFNTFVQSFPQNLMAKMFGFKEEEFFELKDESQKDPVKVSFN